MRMTLVRLGLLVVALALLVPVGLPARRASAVLGCTVGGTFFPVTIQAVGGVPTPATPGNDLIRGTNVADVITGNGGSNVLYGRAGNDTLYGGAQIDSCSGSSGTDTNPAADCEAETGLP